MTYLEDRLKRKEHEAHNLRRERNALLSALREHEQENRRSAVGGGAGGGEGGRPPPKQQDACAERLTASTGRCVGEALAELLADSAE